MEKLVHEQAYIKSNLFREQGTLDGDLILEPSQA
jgi:hypothetical protein